MKTFNLIVDEKVAVWRRSYIKIKADSLEAATNDCVQNGIKNAIDIIDSEYLPETEEYISSDNPITVEVMDEHYNILGSDESY